MFEVVDLSFYLAFWKCFFKVTANRPVETNNNVNVRLLFMFQIIFVSLSWEHVGLHRYSYIKAG